MRLFILTGLFLSCANAFAFEPFVDALPIPKVIKPKGKHPSVSITMNQFKVKLHRDLPQVTVWGYNGISPGPTIEVNRGQKLTVHWKDQLPQKHIFALPDGADMGGPALPDVRAVVHLHGAVVTQTSISDRLHNNDGWPDAWLLNGQEQIAEYPNDQSARNLWYHDHAMASTGRNVAAGLEGMYIIHDDYERSLNLPSGKYDIPLIIQARGIKNDGTLTYVPNLMKEYYGNTIAVNGKLFPYLEVEPRKYRFRIVNASNARTYALKLLENQDRRTPGPEFYQIGSDSGFLENTVVLNDPKNKDSLRLTLAPAERADIIVDFSAYAGHSFLLHNSAKPDDPDAQMPLYQVMLFKVGTKVTGKDSSKIPMKLTPIDRLKETDAAKTRQIVFGQMDMGNMQMMMLNGMSWHDPVTEKPTLGTTEVWELINTLTDAHPFHIHLVQFQVLDRRPYDVDEYLKSGKVVFTAEALAPDANEMGWKDTVRVTRGMITRIIMKFAPYAGHYVYHCHILEHEDMDMMRPFDVISGLSAEPGPAKK